MNVAYLAVLVVSFLASLLGPLCGIGGGVIIKPVVDAMDVMPVATVSFLSGISVLTMSVSTLVQNAATHTSDVDNGPLIPLALGSAVGGVLGKALFKLASEQLPNAELVGAVQAGILIALTVVVLIYTLNRSRVTSLNVTGAVPKAAIGFIAGACWSFLGIGGGPFNMAILVFFFSLNSKPAAQASLLIIAFSQVAALIYAALAGSIPSFEPLVLIGMAAMAVGGSVVGRKLARKANSQTIDRLYEYALILIIAICCYNLLRFTIL